MRLAASAPALPARPVALVVPHAGWSYSGLAAATAFRLLKPGDFERVVVVAPSHQGSFRGYALDDATAYRTPIGDVPLCDGALAALQGADARVVPGVTEREHAVEIELPFLQAALGRFCLVPVLVGDTDDGLERAFAERLATLDDGRTLFVFSSDFAHYGPRFDFQPFGALSPAVRDEGARDGRPRRRRSSRSVDARGFRDYLRETGNTICGRHGLATLLELLPRIAPRARAVPLAHYASADLPGMKDDELGVVRGDGIPARGARPARPSVRPSSRCRGSRTRRPTRRLSRPAKARGSCGSPAPPSPRTSSSATTSAASSRRGRRGPGRERRQGVFVTLNRTDPGEIRAPGPPARLHRPARADLPALLRHRAGRPRRGAARPAVRAGERRRALAARGRGHGPLAAPAGRLVARHPARHARHRPAEGRQGGALPAAGGAGAGLDPRGDARPRCREKAGLPSDGWKDGASFSVFTGQVFEEHP